jgi:hypothetical protein
MLFVVASSFLALFSIALAAPARRATCEGVEPWDQLTESQKEDGTRVTRAYFTRPCPTTVDGTVTVSFVVRLGPVRGTLRTIHLPDCRNIGP